MTGEELGRADSVMTASTEFTEPVELTVVFTTHNRADLIDEGLAALAEQAWDDGCWDILLVDNLSTDDTPEVLKRWVEKMPVTTRVISAPGGRGPSFARNAAVAATTSTSVAFVDDDDLVAPDWVEAIGAALRSSPFVGSRHDFERLNDPALAASRLNQTMELASFHDVAVVSGAGMGCRRSIWNEVGGSNPDFRTGQDIDFALRVSALDDVSATFCREAEYHVRLRDGILPSFEQGERFARAWIRLHKVHPDAVGAKRLSLRRWFRRWIALGFRIRKLGDPTQRLRWAFDLGYELGRLRGAIVYRTWAGE